MASKASWLANAMQMGSVLVCSCATAMLWKLASSPPRNSKQLVGTWVRSAQGFEFKVVYQFNYDSLKRSELFIYPALVIWHLPVPVKRRAVGMRGPC